MACLPQHIGGFPLLHKGWQLLLLSGTLPHLTSLRLTILFSDIGFCASLVYLLLLYFKLPTRYTIKAGLWLLVLLSKEEDDRRIKSHLPLLNGLGLMV